MDKKLRNATNLKGYNKAAVIGATVLQSDKFCENLYLIPTTTTSMSPVILAKDTTGLNQYQSRTPQKVQKHHQNNLKNNNMNNHQTTISAKASACIGSSMEQVAAVHAKTTLIRSKNEEAIIDLRTRIPEIENIFDIHSRIGNGTFSTVLLGTLKKERNLPENLKRKFAIKHHIPTSHPDRIMKELQCMAKIGGSDNVVGINCCIRYNESVAFIMPYLAHDRFHDFYNKMDVAEVQFYMKNLLIALRHVHRFNVIHRDVKPSNFLYNRRRRQFLLVDFGLAQQVPSLHGPANNSKREHLSVPTADNGLSGGEGKRLREQDDENVKKSLNGAAAVTGAGEIVSGIAKRLRCSAPQQEQPQAEMQLDSTIKAANATNTGTILQTLFKMPLKQINEILKTSPIGSKGAVASGDSNASVNEHKSVGGAVSHTMSSRLQQKLRAQGGADSVQNSSNCTSSPGAVKNVASASQTGIVNNNSNNNISVDSKYNTNRNLATSNSPKCYCHGNPQVCNICLVKKEIHASRAGTPGYRPPEVLLKYPDQTTAVDVWAAGVIFLSVLSSVYPFFKAPNDYVALAEMITIFGDKTIRKTAYILDRLVTLSQKTKPLDLRKLCVRFRNRAKFSSPELLKKYQRLDGTCEVCKNCDQFFFNCLCSESAFMTESLDDDDIFPSSAYDLLHRLLEVNPHRRITAEEALRHPFFSECQNNNTLTTSDTTTSCPVTVRKTAHATANQQCIPLISSAAAGDSVQKSRK